MTSDDPKDKLRAALNWDWSHHDENLPVMYLEACRGWFMALTATDKAVAKSARDALERGDERSAEKAAAVLPAAPKFPFW